MEEPVEIIDGPSVCANPDQHCIGIRLITPFRGMFAVRDRLMEELYSWADERATAYGHTFFRLHVVDMDGLMEVEVGVITDEAVPGEGRIGSGVLPDGRYATLSLRRPRSGGTPIASTRSPTRCGRRAARSVRSPA